jgi:FkbH-like protein
MLLNDPRLQLPVITDEAAARSAMVKAQLERQQFRAQTMDEKAYLASLQISCRIGRQTDVSNLQRLEELFQRTTQFNTTGRKFSASELRKLLANPGAHIFALHVSDRFGDHGLSGGAVIVDREILILAMSCRVLGMGIEHRFLRRIMEEVPASLHGRIVETPRNAPVRNLFRDHGFTETAPGVWEQALVVA